MPRDESDQGTYYFDYLTGAPTAIIGPNVSESQLALPLTDNERAASFRSVRPISVGNRFRLIYGAALLPED